MNNSDNPLALKQAAGIAGVSPDTVARWCKRYGIGKQLHSKARWRVDEVGLRIVMAGDGDALSSYLRVPMVVLPHAAGPKVTT